MTTITLSSKKITLATVKSFVKANRDRLFINVESSFDGMYDMCMSKDGGFNPVEAASFEGSPFYIKDMQDTTLGIKGAWFVRQSSDYFRHYDENGFEGIAVSNSCGAFILAIKK
jgi:hypothetical protein